jgi:outer membrane autotransporter protein
MNDCRTVLWAALLCLIAMAGLAPKAAAQTVIDDGDCDDIFFDVDGQGNPYLNNSVLNCTGQLANTHTLIYQSNVIRDIVGRRLITPPFLQNVVPAGLAYDSEAAARNVLAGAGTFRVIPAAETSAAAPVRKWNVWGDAKLSWIDPGDIISPTDGELQNATAGIDYRLSDRVVVGLIASYEHTDLETTGFVLASTQSRGFGGGAYVGATLTDNIVFSGMLTGASLDTDSNFLGALADIDSGRLQASAGLTGYWYSGTTRFSPSVTLAWSKEWQQDFVDSLLFFSPDQTTETAVLSIGGQLGHTFALGGGTSMEPWIGTQWDWTFVNEVKTDGFAAYDLGDSYDLRVQAGLILNLAANAQLSLTGEVSGLIMPDNDIYSGQANLAVQF